MKRGLHFLLLSVLLVIMAAAQGQTGNGRSGGLPAAARSTYFDSQVLLTDVDYLASDELEGRNAERPSIQKARDHLERRFRGSGLKPIGDSFQQRFTIRNRTLAVTHDGVNFIGKISGGKYPEKYIVITAHYDHLGIRDGLIYNGASDNATGTAGILAMADHFKKNRPHHSFLFVAFDAEEQGLQGSLHFMANLPVEKGSIVLNINLDMIAPNSNRELYAAGTFHHPKLRPLVAAAGRRSRIKLLFGHDNKSRDGVQNDWTSQSDHFIFFQEKIPFIYFGVEDHKDYHKPTDDLEAIEPEFFVRSVETIIEATKVLDGGIAKLKWPYN